MKLQELQGSFGQQDNLNTAVKLHPKIKMLFPCYVGACSECFLGLTPESTVQNSRVQTSLGFSSFLETANRLGAAGRCWHVRLASELCHHCFPTTTISCSSHCRSMTKNKSLHWHNNCHVIQSLGRREKQRHTWLRFPCLSLPVFQPSVQAWLMLFWLILYPIYFRLALRAAYKGNFLQCVPLFKQHKLPFSQAVIDRNLLPSVRAKSMNSRALLVKHRADNSFSSRAPHFAGGSSKKFLLILIFLAISILPWNTVKIRTSAEVSV